MAFIDNGFVYYLEQPGDLPKFYVTKEAFDSTDDPVEFEDALPQDTNSYTFLMVISDSIRSRNVAIRLSAP